MLKTHHCPPWPPHLIDFHILTDSLEQPKLDKNHCCQLKGEEAKTRPPETITNADFKILYSKKNLFF